MSWLEAIVIGCTTAGTGTIGALYIAGRQPKFERLRRAHRRAAERRRVGRLSPIEAMVDYKTGRRSEEASDWMLRFRELVPEPASWDHLARTREAQLFSGKTHLIRRAIDPPAPAPKVEEKSDAIARPLLVDRQIVKNAAGYVIYDSHQQIDFNLQLADYNRRHPRKPFDGLHHTTCPYECDCPEQFRRAP